MNKSRWISCLLMFALAWISSGCYLTKNITTLVNTKPRVQITPKPETIVIGNACDVKSKTIRDNKEELFIDLIRIAMKQLVQNINTELSTPAFYAESLSVLPAKKDSCVKALMTTYHGSHAIIITSLNAYFEQSRIDVTESYDGSKSREAFYDVVSQIGYSLYAPSGVHFDTLVTARQHHSSRIVLSGLLALGPNIVSNSEDAAGVTLENTHLYIKTFLPEQKSLIRPLYVTKEFKPVGNEIRVNHYDEALKVSESLTSSINHKTAAIANYNCAVLSELFERFDKVKPFLEESIRKKSISNAELMLKDY